MNAVGWFHVQLGATEKAWRTCGVPWLATGRIEDAFSQADTLDSIGAAYLRLGRYEDAAVHYGQAVELYRDFGYRYSEADTWDCLGDTYLAAGDSGSARARPGATR